MIFQNYLIRKKIQSLLKDAPARKSRFCSFYEAKTFLIAFNIKDKEQVLLCAERLKELGKSVYLNVFIPKKPKVIYEIDAEWLVIKEEELDARGVPANEVSEQFFAIQADTLIDLTRPDDYVMHYMQLKHPCFFKVGNKSSLRNLFDLTVTMGEDDDIPQFFEHILFYLQTIRSK
jgi:sulfur transfer complex TusBCD TusB component (DsrH family)